jgi:hypothetical protein
MIQYRHFAFSVSLVNKNFSALLLSLVVSATAGQFVSWAADGAGEVADNYPRVTIMENDLLGHANTRLPLAQRLEQLELKVFGKVNPENTDLSQRTDNLQTYIEKKLRKPLIQPGADYESPDDDAGQKPQPGAPYQQSQRQSNEQYQQEQYAAPSGLQSSNASGPDAGAPAAPPTDYPRVTALEQAILGQSFVGEALEARLGRMEEKAFGQVSANAALGDRTDALEDYAEKVLRKPILGQTSLNSTPEEPADGETVGGSGLFSKVGKALLGVPSGGKPGAGPAFMIPAFGAFGGVRVRPRSAVQSEVAQAQAQEEEYEKVHQDDVLINAPQPPADNARMLAKVGWCEQKVYGQVYYQNHLVARLEQLNETLQYKPGRKGLELMDEIKGLTQAAQAYKH